MRHRLSLAAEGDVQIGEPAQDEGRLVGVAAVLPGPCRSSSIAIVPNRSRSRSTETRPSTRASGAPGHEWMPRLNARCSRTLRRLMSNSWGFSNRRGSRLTAPGLTITVVPAGVSTSPTVVVLRAIRNTVFTGLSIRRHSSMKFGMRLRSARSVSCSSGRSPSTRSAALSSLAVVS